mmetsp:Transcript_14961/g.32889  ORF Transcript_14961/g.32889 Transcript_14961/m.32889 type:complete len:223 (+) Transcript_14961:95-763(+)
MANQLNLNCISSFRNTPKYSFKGRYSSKDPDLAPGPGQYKPLQVDKDKFNRSPQFAMGSPGKEEEKDKPAMPGPGQYKPVENSYHGSPKWPFGSETRLHELRRSLTPGPGSYETRGGLDGLHKSISHASRSGGSRALTPGPGTYRSASEQTLSSPPKFSFGAGMRTELVNSRTPGPGSYEAPSSLCGNVTMRTAGKYSMKFRHGPRGPDTTPGPVAAGTTFR